MPNVVLPDCRCGCDKPAIPGTEVEAAKLVILRMLASRLRVVAALEGERGEAARDLLYGYQRAEYGLDGFIHQDYDHIPVMLGVPTASWIETWRRRALEVLKKHEPGRRRFWRRQE